MIIHQQNQKCVPAVAPLATGHQGRACGHDEKSIVKISAISRPRTENQNAEKLTN
jgi:hypothetical protein